MILLAAELRPDDGAARPRGEAGQEGRLLERRVAATHDRDLLAPEEEAVAGGAGADAAAPQSRLAVETQPQRAGAGGHDDRLGAVLDAAAHSRKGRAVEVDTVDVDVHEARPEALGLLAEAGP